MHRPARWIARLLPWLLMLPLTAYAALPGTPARAANALQPAVASSSLASAIDYTRHVDSDCVIKNIGNCCGYLTACVNRNSPADPAAAQAECKRKGMMSACGLPAIQSCRCVMQRCVAVNDATAFGPR